jgi:hypothetical protein
MIINLKFDAPKKHQMFGNVSLGEQKTKKHAYK